MQTIIFLSILSIIHKVHGWSWSRSPSTYGPQGKSGVCIVNSSVQLCGQSSITFPSNYGNDDDGNQEEVVNDKIYLFGGQVPLQDINGAGASIDSSSKTSVSQTLKEAREASSKRQKQEAMVTATHDLWVYEKDKVDTTTNDNEWTLISRKEQGISRPTPRTNAATSRLGHLMFLFGGIDSKTNKQLSDVWTLSLLTNKWSLSQAILPIDEVDCSRLVACAISNTKVALICNGGKVMVYNDDLPTPCIEEVPIDNTNNDGPDIGLGNFACCAIPQTANDDEDSSTSYEAVDDLHGYKSRAAVKERSMNYVKAAEGELKDVLLYGGSTGDKYSSDAFKLDTKTYKWTKLKTISNDCHPRALIDASITSIRKNQCILYGGASLNERQQTTVCDETWLLTIDDNNEANWERIANLPEDAVESGSVPLCPDGRTLASLLATSSDELVLQGGYNPLTKQTYGGSGGGGTWLLTRHPIDHAKIAMERAAREQELKDIQLSETEATASRVADMIASAGLGKGFDGGNLGVGGLDHVLEEIKTRIWTPLAAPPKLLADLGIQPTRGLLLYGGPGCGKTLLASKLGSILSPFRPITVVNGPEVLDKFVGSSEQNLRDIFDNPPDIYDKYKWNETDGGEALGRAAIHVVVMDEFDAIARNRGAGGGGQGDAGVARDSVVNQLLSKMDGVNPLKTTTLVIGLTNKKELIDPALLRPGRFEVQIEIEPPKTVEQRRSIVMVHTKQMFETGRLEVNNPPIGSAAETHFKKTKHLENNILSYAQLVEQLAIDCDGFSGASIAGVTRAAASRALARSVGRLSSGDKVDSPSSIMDCIVSQDDLYHAIQIVRGRSRNLDSVVEDERDESATRTLQIVDDYELRTNKVDQEWKQERMELNIAQLAQTVSDLEEKLERLKMI